MTSGFSHKGRASVDRSCRFEASVITSHRTWHSAEPVRDPPGCTSGHFSSSRDMACSVAGITSDANVLTNELRLIAQRYGQKERS